MPQRRQCYCGHPLQWNTWQRVWQHLWPHLLTNVPSHEPKPRAAQPRRGTW